MKTIFIYADYGVSQDCLQGLQQFFYNHSDDSQLSIQYVIAKDLKQSNWIQYAQLLIMPGGRSLPFYDSLGEAGNQNIIRFVEQGGSYLGLCAGAYYASEKTIFSEGLPNELLLSGPLNFFKGSAIGPVFAAEEFEYHSERGARIIDIVYNGVVYPVYYNGGCYFDAPEITVLATYCDNHKSQKPAIISCSAGLGKVILSGVHPEISINQSLGRVQLMSQLLSRLLSQ